MVSNLDKNIKFPFRCISYYASDKSAMDGKNSYEFWTRSKLTRIVCNKPFSRGDVLQVDSITEIPNGTLINTTLIDEWQEEYPVLTFISGRLVYNKWVNFKFTPTEGIQILYPIEQVISDNYSIGFVCLVYKSGKISCVDSTTDNRFDIYANLSWE